MDNCSIPNIFLDFRGDRPLKIRWGYLENLADDALKQQIIIYSKLINSVSRVLSEQGQMELDYVKEFSVAVETSI
jgi:hypothetical protein